MPNYVLYKIEINGKDRIDKSAVLNNLKVVRHTEFQNRYYIDLDKYVKLPDDVIHSTSIIDIIAISRYIYENNITDEIEISKLKYIDGYINKKVAELQSTDVNFGDAVVNKGMSLHDYIKNAPKDLPILESKTSVMRSLWGSTSMPSSVAIGENDDCTLDIYFRVAYYPLNSHIHSLLVKNIKDVCNCDVTILYMEEFMNNIGKIYYNGVTNTINMNAVNMISDVFDIIQTFFDNIIPISFGGCTEYIVNNDLINVIRYKKVTTLDELVKVINESKLRLFSSDINVEMIREDLELHLSENDCQWINDSIYENVIQYIESNFDSAVISHELVEFMFGNLFKYIGHDSIYEKVDGDI